MISKEESCLLRSESAQAEKIGRLTDKQLAVLYNNGLFNMYVPTSLGGLGYDFITALTCCEKLATIDGSLGWTVTLCSGANMFVGFIAEDLAKHLFSTPQVCLAGSGRVSGVAKDLGEVYEISGTWDTITGLHHATAFTANCHLEIDGALQYTSEGMPVYKSFVFLPEEVEVIHNWQTMGLKATGSDAFSIKNLKVSKHRSFEILPEAKVFSYPIYNFPFMPFAKFTLAVNHLGMQENYLTVLEEYFQRNTKHRYVDMHQALLQTLRARLLKRRTAFYALAEHCWELVQKEEILTEEMHQEITELMKHIVREGRDDLMQSLPYTGIYGIREEEPLNRIVRDVLSACQHSLFL